MHLWTVVPFLSISLQKLIFPVQAMPDTIINSIDYTRLFCPAELPQFPYGERSASWPYGLTGTSLMIRDILKEQECDVDDWSWRNFTTLTDLCSAQGNPNGNMGGACAPNPTLLSPRKPKFDTRVARTSLLYNIHLLEYCQDECFCANDEDDWLASDLWVEIYDRNMPRAILPETTPSPQTTPTARMWSSFEGSIPSENANQQQILTYAGPTFRCTVTNRGSPRQSVSCSCRRSRIGPSLPIRPAPPRPPSRLPIGG